MRSDVTTLTRPQNVRPASTTVRDVAHPAPLAALEPTRSA
jgi:hypothetical protein